MNALTIKDPADLLSFIGHTLGFWPQESLVCITLNKDKVGATLRIDLPKQSGLEIHSARTVAAYLTSDERANVIVFALYTSENLEPGEARPQRATTAASPEYQSKKASPSAMASTSPTPPTTPTLVRTSRSRSAAPNTPRSTPNSHLPRQRHRTHQPSNPPDGDPQARGHCRRRTSHESDPQPVTGRSRPGRARALERDAEHEELPPPTTMSSNHPRPELVQERRGQTTPHPHRPRTRSTRPHHHRLHQLVGRPRMQSPPIPPTSPRRRPRPPLRTPHRPHARRGIIAGWNTNRSTTYKTRLDMP